MIFCTVQNDVAFIEMNDGKANAVNEIFANEFLKALNLAENAKAVVLSGRSGFFSAGLDLKNLPTLDSKGLQAALDGFETVTRRLASFPRPIVAAVAGHALGAGACFLLACDYVFAAAPGQYRLGLNETSIGVPLPPFLLELARLKLLPKVHVRALLHGEIFSLNDAAEFGFIDEFVTSENLMLTATERANTLAKIPVNAYLETKKILRQKILEMPFPQIAAYVGPAFQTQKKDGH